MHRARGRQDPGGARLSTSTRALEDLRARDVKAWRLLLSDEIHPNMDGHKRIAELLASAIIGRSITLAKVPPPSPALRRTGERLRAVNRSASSPCRRSMA